MKFEEFVKEVMRRASLDSRAHAQEATRATLETLSEHLTPGEVQNFASQLPPELAVYMKQPYVGGVSDRFSLDEFFQRVSQRVQPDGDPRLLRVEQAGLQGRLGERPGLVAVLAVEEIASPGQQFADCDVSTGALDRVA